MSIVTDIRTRAEEAIDRTATTVNEVVGELRNVNVNDVTARARDLVAAVPTVDVQRLVSTVDGYRKAAQEQVDELLHADPRVAKVADAVESYNKFTLQQIEDVVEQVRKDPRVSKVVETVDEKVVKPARARFAGAEQNLEDKQVVKADPDAPVEVKPVPAAPAAKVPADKVAADKAPARKGATRAVPARKAPARKTTTAKAAPTA